MVPGGAGGGAAFALMQYAAPAAAYGTFCGDLKAKQYAAAYALLGGDLQSQVAQAPFTQAMTNLDAAEGPVTTCGAAQNGGSSSYRLFSGSATAGVTMTRASAGVLRGNVTLRNEGGSWKVASVDDALFGAPLRAVAVFSAYCADFASQNDSDAYALYASAIQKSVKQSDFTSQEGVQGQLDGKVSDCHLTSIGKDATATSVSLSASITRATLGERKGNFTLEQGAWKVSHEDAQLFGTDLNPLAVTVSFCSALHAGNYQAAFGLLSPNATAGSTEADFAAVFSGNYNGIKWVDCSPDLKTYKVNGNSASVTVQLTVQQVATGASSTGPVALTLKVVGNAWKIDDMQNQAS